MAEDLMRDRMDSRTMAGEAGFSMVEMLMTAFILAIGLLGLCMLQTYSLRASRGSRSLSTAVKISEKVLDQVEMEGRLSWLNVTDTTRSSPGLADLPNLDYLNIAVGGHRVETYNSQGGATDATSADPVVQATFFTVTTTRQADVGLASGSGQISDFNVQVTFADSVDKNAVPVQRTVSLTRRIIHG